MTSERKIGTSLFWTSVRASGRILTLNPRTAEYRGVLDGGGPDYVPPGDGADVGGVDRDILRFQLPHQRLQRPDGVGLDDDADVLGVDPRRLQLRSYLLGHSIDIFALGHYSDRRTSEGALDLGSRDLDAAGRSHVFYGKKTLFAPDLREGAGLEEGPDLGDDRVPQGSDDDGVPGPKLAIVEDNVEGGAEAPLLLHLQDCPNAGAARPDPQVLLQKLLGKA